MTWNKTQFTEFFVQNGMWYFFPFLYRNLEWTGTSLKKVERPSLVLVGSGRKCVWSCFSKWLFWKVQKKIKKLKTTFDFRLMLEIQGFQCLPGEVLASCAILWTLWANCCSCFRTVRVPFNGNKAHTANDASSWWWNDCMMIRLQETSFFTIKIIDFPVFDESVTNGPTDGRTDGPMDGQTLI